MTIRAPSPEGLHPCSELQTSKHLLLIFGMPHFGKLSPQPEVASQFELGCVFLQQIFHVTPLLLSRSKESGTQARGNDPPPGPAAARLSTHERRGNRRCRAGVSA